MEISEMRNRYNQLLGQKKVIEKLYNEAKTDFIKLETKYDKALITQSLIQQAAINTQEKLRFNIEKIVTAFIQALPFDEEYTFKLEFTTKNDRTHCIPRFLDKDGEEFDGLADLGGSVVNPAAFANRISLWTLMGENKTDPIFILDETFGNVREDFWEDLASVVKAICDDFGIQLLITSVAPIFNEVSDNIIEMKKEGGYSTAYVL